MDSAIDIYDSATLNRYIVATWGFSCYHVSAYGGTRTGPEEDAWDERSGADWLARADLAGDYKRRMQRERIIIQLILTRILQVWSDTLLTCYFSLLDSEPFLPSPVSLATVGVIKIASFYLHEQP